MDQILEKLLLAIWRGHLRFEKITINVPVVFMAQYVMVLRSATALRGALEGMGPENQDFFGPSNGTSKASAIWAKKNSHACVPLSIKIKLFIFRNLEVRRPVDPWQILREGRPRCWLAGSCPGWWGEKISHSPFKEERRFLPREDYKGSVLNVIFYFTNK